MTLPSPYISVHPDNESPLVIDIHDDGIRIYVDRKLTAADCRRLAATLNDAADLAARRYWCSECGQWFEHHPCPRTGQHSR